MPSEVTLEPKAGKPKFQIGDALSKLKGGLSALKKKKSDGEDEDLAHESSAKKNPLQGMLSKLKFGKKPIEEDVPTNNFASLKEKLSQFSKGADKDLDDKPMPLRKDTGTSSLKTLQEEPDVQSLSDQEKESIEHEVGAATELAELKGKYNKMESMLSEKNSELEKNKTSFDSEVGHRKDFNKIKDLLEKELKEVKERVKTVRQDHVNAVQEKDNALRRIKQLDEKSTKLEKEILALEKENDQLRRQIKQAGLKEPPKMAPVVEEVHSAPLDEPPPAAAAPAAATPMDLPPAFKEVQSKSKISKDDISKFEESLGFSSHEVAAEVPLTPPPAPEPPIVETPKPVEEPPAAIVEPSAPPAAVEEPPGAVVEPPAAVVEPPPVEPPAPPPAPESPVVEPAFEEPTPPEREVDDDDRESGGFLKLSPDPLSDSSAPKPPQEPPSDKPEDKKE